jgi:hypothetical protein
MKSRQPGKDTSVNVENITPLGIWMYIKGKEYFLDYVNFPFFKKQSVGSIFNVQLIHGFHLHWPDLDIDLELDNLENPAKYPLKYNSEVLSVSESSKTDYKSGK